MAFHVHPDNQNAPLTVPPAPPPPAPAPPPVLVPIGQLTGPSVPAGSYAKMMFIRVATTGGATSPTVLIQAGAGPVVPVTPVSTGVNRGPGAEDYVGDVRLFGEADNVQQVRMGMFADTAESWRIGFRNNGAVAQEITWVVAESLAETAQPWIAVGSGALAFHGLVSETIPQQLTVANKGTGPLTFTPALTLPAGFEVTSPLPLTVAPTGSAPLTVTFTADPTPPPPSGTGTATLDLIADPPDTTAKTTGAGHNRRVALSTSTQALEVVLLLDDSGSMGTDALGNPPPDNAHSRWGELTSAANQFLDLLAHFAEKRGRFGIARFPAPDPLNPSTYDISPMAPIPDKAGMAVPQTAISAITPFNSTPMGDGLDRVLAPATGYFATDALSLAAHRRWLILLSDGAHNSGDHNPLEFIAPPVGTAAPGASLEDRRVHLFGVSYGIDGHTDVNHVLMKQLATGSAGGGQVRNVDDEGMTASKLALALRDVLKAGLTPTAAPRDPEGRYPGDGEVRHEAVLTPYDGRVAFVLSWNTPDPGRLRLRLLSPAGEEFSPDFTVAGITLRRGDRSQIYLLDADFLVGRYGTWTLVVSGTPGPQERYVYDVLAETSLRMAVELDAPTYFAGEPITVSARLTAAGGPVLGAAVTLTVDAPRTSVANWLAAASVPADAMNRATEQLAHADGSALLVKQVAAELAGLSYDAVRSTVTLPMTDPDGTGTYRATVVATTVPERYGFAVTALGQVDGIDFRREGTAETYVLVRPKATSSVLDVHHVSATLANITVVPRDEFGNVLLVDPLTAGGFGLLDGREGTLGALVSNLDGTYTSPVRIEAGQTGLDIGVVLGGDQIIPSTKLQLPDVLRFPDIVLGVDHGVVIHQKVPDAVDVLGHVIGKGHALPLGAGGSVTVGFSHQVVLADAGGEPDVTVFVRSDGDLRAYRLEARDPGRRTWVTVGESVGTTESFSLAATGLAAASALRVTDLSGQLRDRDDVPLDAPGVNVLGIGVRSTGPVDETVAER